MKYIIVQLSIGFLFLFPLNTFGHTTELVYCYDCDGNLTLYLSTTGALEDDVDQRAYQYSFRFTIDGVVTDYTQISHNGNPTTHPGALANGWFEGTRNNLPSCEGSNTSAGRCKTEQEWSIFYFPNMPRGVQITVQITDEFNGNDTQLDCDEVEQTASFYIPIAPIAEGGGDFCVNQSTNLSVHTTQFESWIKNLGGGYVDSDGNNVAGPTPSDTSHTVQWQVADAPGGPWENVPGATTHNLNLSPLNVLGVKYYQALYLSSSTTEIVPAHWDTIAEISGCCKTDGVTDSVLVEADTVWFPDSEILVSAGGCALVSTLIRVGTFIGPVANAGTDTTVCSSTSLKGMGDVPNPTWTYSWSPTTGLSDPNIGNPNLTLDNIGSTEYILTAMNPACPIAAFDTALINVIDLPTATITGNATLCQGASDPLITFTGAGGTAPYTFTYTVGGSTETISTTSGNSVTLAVSTAATGTFSYDLVSVVESGPQSCSQAQTGNATVIVGELPTASISGATTKCLNDTEPDITFTGLTGTAPFNFTYTVNGASNSVTTTTGNSVTISAPTDVAGTFTYSLVSVQDAACSQNQTGSVDVTVNPLGGSITATNDVCQNAAGLDITFTGTGGTAPYTFNYTIDGVVATETTAGGSSTITIAAPTGTIGSSVYTLTGVQEGGGLTCASASSVTVSVNAIPSATIAGTITLCKNTNEPDITFTGADGTPPYTFTYTLDGVTSTVSTDSGTNSVTVAAPTGTPGTFTYEIVSVTEGSSSACSNTATGTAMVTINPAPNASITGTTTVCVGDADPIITFTGSDGTAPYTFNYTLGATSLSETTPAGSNSSTISAPTTAPGVFTYSLTSVQDAAASTCGFADEYIEITVNAIPTITVNDAAICIGETTILTAIGASNYTWEDGSTEDTLSVSPTSDTPYTVTGGNSGCTMDATGTVTVNPLPVILVNDTIVCIGENAMVIAGGGSNYTWSNGTTGNTLNLITPPSTATYTVTVTDVNSCVDSATSTVTVISAPVVTVNSGAICSGDNITLTASGASSYVWYDGSTTNPINVSPASTTSYSVTGSSGGCSSADTAVVTVSGIPDSPFTASSSCEGKNSTITYTGTAPPNAIYTWDFAGGTVVSGSGQGPYSVSWPIAGSPNTTLTVAIGSCTSTLTTVPVTVFPSPLISAIPDTICAGETAILTPNGALTYTWTPGGTNGVLTASPLPGINSYTVTGTDANNCTASFPTGIFVFANPNANFSISPNQIGKYDPTVSFTSQSSANVSYWFWDFGDGELLDNNTEHPTHKYPSDTATYTVTNIVGNEGLCYDTILHLVVIGPEYSFYIPNAFSPNEDGLNDLFLGQGENLYEYRLSIYDRWGNFIFYTTDINVGWDGSIYGGELSLQDVFVWTVEFEDLYHKKYRYYGTVTIVRDD